ncbi:hypothetical protein EDEG_02398 [Edhazardia aedis USNM 41457]|uniref:Uncharacterized protein n=1 Tax=Edhazardia aedis (strain USNM 41457) TaxID=1003232 RepID=J9DKW2_EDHAE|nr:hypothetical protein EDEG_02398 [Edhazardia aedis USNM 41457]|eukprot:EJW03230.1 hypothetical protein EDEG_02398 [Edhazardia aedis USNM 41457]
MFCILKLLEENGRLTYVEISLYLDRNCHKDLILLNRYDLIKKCLNNKNADHAYKHKKKQYISKTNIQNRIGSNYTVLDQQYILNNHYKGGNVDISNVRKHFKILLQHFLCDY